MLNRTELRHSRCYLEMSCQASVCGSPWLWTTLLQIPFQDILSKQELHAVPRNVSQKGSLQCFTGKCLTTTVCGWGDLTVSICQFLWCKLSYSGQSQASKRKLVNMELGIDALTCPSQLVGADSRSPLAVSGLTQEKYRGRDIYDWILRTPAMSIID